MICNTALVGLVCALGMLCSGCSTGEDDWIRIGQAGGEGADSAADVAVFGDRSFVLAGSFEVVATFGRAEASETHLTSGGLGDAFVARYYPSGTLAWARRAGGASAVGATSVAASADGSCVVAGAFQGIATFGAGEANETDLVGEGVEDAFVARYDLDGYLAWATRASGDGYCVCRGVAAFPDGTCVAVGPFDDTTVFGPGEHKQTPLTTAGSNDIFVAHYDANGTLAWARRVGGTGSDVANDVAGLADGSFVVGGRFEETVIFGEGELGQTQLVSAGGTDIFVARYNADGSLAWARRAGGAEGEQSWGIAILADGACVAAGSFNGDAIFGAGEANETQLVWQGGQDLFVARYDADGSLAWARRAGGVTSTVGRAVAVFGDGSCVVTGRFEGTATFGPGESGETSITSVGGSNCFVARYQPSGNLLWAKLARSTSSVAGAAVAGWSDGNSLVAGFFVDIATFRPGEVGETDLVGEGGRDAFFARYDPVGE